MDNIVAISWSLLVKNWSKMGQIDDDFEASSSLPLPSDDSDAEPASSSIIHGWAEVGQLPRKKNRQEVQSPNDLVYDREHDLFEWPELDLDLTSDSRTVAPEEPRGMNDDRFKPEDARILDSMVNQAMLSATISSQVVLP